MVRVQRVSLPPLVNKQKKRKPSGINPWRAKASKTVLVTTRFRSSEAPEQVSAVKLPLAVTLFFFILDIVLADTSIQQYLIIFVLYAFQKSYFPCASIKCVDGC